ncbi:MAG: hypothetical protein G01um1014106_45 [Parcubacteria group bacterium Gr01-1014_106]|nr:MAG: hypothetical protein G01um1014106_45 [Parcubacteria group bacterium Gr01-1014_106]
MRRAVLWAAATILLLPHIAASAAFEFEFLNAEKNYQRQETFPFGVPNEIVVASQTTDVRTLLPIAIVMRVGTNRYRNAIPNTPEQTCRGADGCSIPGPVIPQPPPNTFVEVNAIDKNGRVLVTHTEGKKPPSSVVPSGPEPTAPVPSSRLLPTDMPSASLPPSSSPASTLQDPATRSRSNLITVLAVVALIGAVAVGGFLLVGHAQPVGEKDPCEALRRMLGILCETLRSRRERLKKAREKLKKLEEEFQAEDGKDEAAADAHRPKLRKERAEVKDIENDIHETKGYIDEQERKLAKCEKREPRENPCDSGAAATVGEGTGSGQIFVPRSDPVSGEPPGPCESGAKRTGKPTTYQIKVLDPKEPVVVQFVRGAAGAGKSAEQFASWLELLKRIPGGKVVLPLPLIKEILALGAQIAREAAGFEQQAPILYVRINYLELAYDCTPVRVCVRRRWESRFEVWWNPVETPGFEEYHVGNLAHAGGALTARQFPEWLASTLQNLGIAAERPEHPCGSSGE